MDRNIFVLANAFREDRELLSMRILEDRLWMLIVSKVKAMSKPGQAFDVTQEVEIHAEEYSAVYKDSRSNVYRDMARGAYGLKRMLTEVRTDPRNIQRGFRSMSWFQHIDYEPEQGKVVLAVTLRVAEQITQQDKNFTKFDLSGAADLKGKYALRLYRYLASVKAQKKIELTLEEFKHYLGITGCYPVLGNLKMRVLDPAVEEINQKSDMYCSYKNIVLGRKVTGLSFTFKVKKSKNPDNKVPDKSSEQAPAKYAHPSHKPVSFDKKGNPITP